MDIHARSQLPDVLWSQWCCLQSFEVCSISMHPKSQANWVQAYSLIHLPHWMHDFRKVQTMSKPNIVLCKHQQGVNFFCTICKPINLSNFEILCKILLIRSLFLHAYYVPHNPGSIRWSYFWGSKKVYSGLYSLHRFAPRCHSIAQSLSLWNRCAKGIRSLRAQPVKEMQHTHVGTAGPKRARIMAEFGKDKKKKTS